MVPWPQALLSLLLMITVCCFCELYITNLCISIVFSWFAYVLFLFVLLSLSCLFFLQHPLSFALNLWFPPCRSIHSLFISIFVSFNPSNPRTWRTSHSVLSRWMTAKGRTNIELREQFILAEGVSQSMTAFRPKASPGGSSTASQRSPSLAGPITKVCLACPWSSTLFPSCIVCNEMHLYFPAWCLSRLVGVIPVQYLHWLFHTTEKLKLYIYTRSLFPNTALF